MPKRVVTLPRSSGVAALDIVSYGRRGPGEGGPLTTEQVDQVTRTVRRTPEVMVKVSGGGRDAAGVRAHVDYVGRHGGLGIETDDGREVQGKDAGAELIADWNLDLSRGQYRPRQRDGQMDQRPKVVHNIVLSMPGRTPPEAVLAAARRFARENFALQYRYAMVLHTDQAHPHVHLIVKAEHEYEPGKRLAIRKATLRQWREDCAAFLREEGVAANATPAALRGRPRTNHKDAIHQRSKSLASFEALPSDVRALRRSPQESTFMRAKVEAVAAELRDGRPITQPGLATLQGTRQQVANDWMATAGRLREHGQAALAAEVEQFAASLPAVRTEQAKIAAGLLAQVEVIRSGVPTRPPDVRSVEPDR